MTKITKADIVGWIENTTGMFSIDDIKRQLNIDNSCYNNLKVILHRLCKEKYIKSTGRHDGTYRRVNNSVVPQVFWNLPDSGEMNISFPYSPIDNTSFNFSQHNIKIFKGDAIVLGGNSNAGKSLWCLNFLLQNMDTYKIRYYTNEKSHYKIWNRLKYVDWTDIFYTDNPEKPEDCKFELIYRDSDYEDVLYDADIHIIDWINITDEIWKIGKMIHNLKELNPNGLVIVVLQKSRSREIGVGGDWNLHFADLGLVLDFGRLTVIKCKSNGFLDGKLMYGFEVADSIRFKNIREVIKCDKCGGYGKKYSKDCSTCNGTGYRDKEDFLTDVD